VVIDMEDLFSHFELKSKGVGSEKRK
jgi:hypothetical protein